MATVFLLRPHKGGCRYHETPLGGTGGEGKIAHLAGWKPACGSVCLKSQGTVEPLRARHTCSWSVWLHSELRLGFFIPCPSRNQVFPHVHVQACMFNIGVGFLFQALKRQPDMRVATLALRPRTLPSFVDWPMPTNYTIESRFTPKPDFLTSPHSYSIL